ncbi:MAG: RNA polymerase sigma factor [Bacteroidales bacterium]|nr:RNA polymerase sigma factor [Bacteroidales bacterium]
MSPKVFQDKYLTLTPQLYSVALNILHNAQDAEDAVQETFMKVWAQADRVEQMEKPKAFFATVLRNVCMDTLRERQHTVDEEVTDDIAPPEAEEPQVGEPSFVRRLLGVLNPKARKVVTLRHIGEYSMQDIAQLTGDSEVNIRAVLSRARQKLRQEYLKAMDAPSD